ncbi:FAD-dependent monooxygenase [Amycolatopsis sp. NPDC049253]|uniref:FAD-dependent oxidoreductase n=1 Tax=Amycolatopsis sp. NPDC049253 TaxID=3155274 RepID=UPI00341DB70D
MLDRAARWSDDGAGISLAANGMRVLTEPGLGDAMAAVSRTQYGGGVRTRGGRRLQRLEGHKLEREVGFAITDVSRRDLRELLLDALPEGVHDVGSPVVSADPETGTVRREDGTTLRADPVVPRRVPSVLRRHVEPVDSVTGGYTVVRAVVDDPGGVEGDFELRWGAGLEFGCVRLVFATPQEAVLRHGIRVLPRPLATFVRGKLVLLGDAAHPVVPNLGQGACLALEDALTLVPYLQQDPATALGRYDEVRVPVVKAARLAARMSLHLPAALRDAPAAAPDRHGEGVDEGGALGPAAAQPFSPDSVTPRTR